MNIFADLEARVKSALEDLKRHLVARATVVTPNLPEAELLAGTKIASMADRRRAAAAILALGAKAVLLKGGHGDENPADRRVRHLPRDPCADAATPIRRRRHARQPPGIIRAARRPVPRLVHRGRHISARPQSAQETPAPTRGANREKSGMK